ncbi:MAG: apolipoprotein N-acyltransferase, partial [Spirochaetales bacterium]|nr:apolipoprotein N-acyltransferase [Candidatus Physcosoma equi]
MKKFFRGLLVFLLKTILMLGSAYLASLAFPSKHMEGGIPWLAFFYLVPVFFVIFSSKYQTVWFYGFVYGFSFYLFYNYWLSTFHPLAILIAPSLESIQYILLFLVLRATKSVARRHYGLFAGLVYNGYLYLTQNGFLAYPYGNLTSAVYTYSSLIQIVSITGIWGLGLVMTLPQTVFAEILSERKWRRLRLDFLLSLLLLSLTWGLGFISHSYYEEKEPERVMRIAAIQHSADTWKGGYDTYRDNFYNLMDLTREAMEEEPEMVVWSETAFVPSVTWHKLFPMYNATDRLCVQFEEFGKSLGIPLITGNPEGIQDDPNQGAINEEGDWNWITYNT